MGIAGLTYALKVADFGTVAIITKADEDESNTKYARVELPRCLFLLIVSKNILLIHLLQVMVNVMKKLCIVVTEGSERVRELIEWGTDFDRKPDRHTEILRAKVDTANIVYFITKM